MLADLWSATLDVFISPKFYVLGSFVRQRNKPLPLVFPLTCNICLNKWFKPPMFNSRECQGYFQMFLLLKANKIKLFFYYCFKTNKALWFTRTPGFAGGVWHHQGLGFQQLLGHLWQMFVPCQAEQPAGNSRIKKKRWEWEKALLVWCFFCFQKCEDKPSVSLSSLFGGCSAHICPGILCSRY